MGREKVELERKGQSRLGIGHHSTIGRDILFLKGFQKRLVVFLVSRLNALVQDRSDSGYDLSRVHQEGIAGEVYVGLTMGRVLRRSTRVKPIPKLGLLVIVQTVFAPWNPLVEPGAHAFE